MINHERKLDKEKKVLLACFMLVFFLLPGCWDKRELDERSIVLSTAVDREKDHFLLSTEIVKPSQMGGGSSAESPQGSGGMSAFICQSTGKTMFEAVVNAQTKVSRTLYFSHDRVIVLGRSLAQQGYYPALDYIIRDIKPRPTTWVLVASEKGADILMVKPQLEKTVGQTLDVMMKNAVKSHIPEMTLDQTVAEVQSFPLAYLVPMVKIKGEKEKTILLDGTAGVFIRDKMVGEMNVRESRGVKWVTDHFAKTVVNAFPEKGGKISATIRHSKGKMKISFDRGKPRAQIEIYAEGIISEQENISGPVTVQMIKKETGLIEEAIKKEVESALQKAQSMKADVFGFGRELYRNHPKEWKKLKGSWGETFSTMAVTVSVRAVLSESGLLAMPPMP